MSEEIINANGSRNFQANILLDNVKRLEEENKRLQAENERLKAQIKQLEDFIKSDGEIDHINHEYTYKLKKVLQEVKAIARGVRSYLEVPAPRDVRFEMDRILNLITEMELPDQKESEVSDKYKQALEEIREMVNEPCVPSENDCLTCPTSCFTKDILIKINEVLEVNNG